MALSVNLYICKTALFIRLYGEMDEHASNDLRLRLNEIIARYRINHLVFNMQNLSFLDSSGIGVILGRFNQIKHRNGQVVLCELNENIKRIIMLSGLERICVIKETEDNAKWYLKIA